MKKPENLRDSSKLDPLIFSGFFSLLRKPGRLCRPDCRWVDLCVSFAVSLRRNERKARCGAGLGDNAVCGQRYPHPPSRSFFPQKKRRTLTGDTTQ